MQHILAPKHSGHFRRHIKLYNSRPAPLTERITDWSLFQNLYHLHCLWAPPSGTDFGVGLSRRDSGALQFFCTLATGILFEDAVEAIWNHVMKSNSSEQLTPPLWQRGVGYLWTIIFLSWCTPKWIFPMLERHRAGIDEVYPFGLAQYVVRK